MLEFLGNVWIITKAFFTEWIPLLKSASLGVIGQFKEVIGIVLAIVIGLTALIEIFKRR